MSVLIVDNQTPSAWHYAALPPGVQVVVSADPEAASRGLGADVLIVDGRDGHVPHRAFVAMMRKMTPRVALLLHDGFSRLPDTSHSDEIHRSLLKTLQYARSFDLNSCWMPSYGSYLFQRMHMTCWVARTSGPMTMPIRPLYGPQAVNDQGIPTVWPRGPFAYRGVPFKVLTTEAMTFIQEAVAGGQPLVQAGMPFTIPAHVPTWDVPTDDGEKRVAGVLAHSVSDPGGFVVLTMQDILIIQGYPSDVLGDDSSMAIHDVSGLLSVHVADHILEWTTRIEQ